MVEARDDLTAPLLAAAGREGARGWPIAVGAMHKKQASLVPLNFEYGGAFSSSDAELPSSHGPETPETAGFRTPSANGSAVLGRTAGARSRTPDLPLPCACDLPDVPGRARPSAARAASGGLAALFEAAPRGGGGAAAPGRAVPAAPRTRASSGPSSPAAPPSPAGEAAVTVDGHRALARLTAEGLAWSYAGGSACCVPAARAEALPFAEILSARVVAAPPTRFWGRLAPTRGARLEVFTFSRAASDASAWAPRTVAVAAPAEALLQAWCRAINAAAAAQPRRPRALLVFVNPFGGRRRAGATFARVVAPVLAAAGAECTKVTTRHGGHAREALLAMPAEELARYDGVVVVGGDGLFHEVANALLELRTLGFSQRGGGGVTDGPAAARGAAAARLRLGHVPAGSTDAVACSLHGTRSAFAAAAHVALGDGVPLDAARLEAAGAPGRSLFTLSMASYGYFGDVMAASERMRALGPARYELAGAATLLAGRSYGARVEWLPAGEEEGGGGGGAPPKRLLERPCSSACAACDRAAGGRGGAPAAEAALARSPSRPDLGARRASAAAAPEAPHAGPGAAALPHGWRVAEGEFAAIMLVVLPCRSEKSAAGVARHGHLSDGALHLVMVRRCSRPALLAFLWRLSRRGLVAGRHGAVEVARAAAVRVAPRGGGAQGAWNVDGELVHGAALAAEVHRGALEVFARGVEAA